ncbi:MAG: Dyp-type peroxidase family [Caulobacter sp.]|nr:Dyp-type peroxidase family [Caulobacter sp.]
MAVIPSPWPLHRIQGLVLRGYSQPFVRYFPLSVADLTAARAFLASLLTVTGDGTPQITSAEPWQIRPASLLNIGFTWRGLHRLGVDQDSLNSFQNSDSNPFVWGSAQSATLIGDVCDSDPKHWIVDDQDFDVMLMLFTDSEEDLETASIDLAKRFEAGFGSYDPAGALDTQALPDDQIYFGYRDSIAQPNIVGSPFNKVDGGQDEADPGAFMLGVVDPNKSPVRAPAPTPPLLGQYGTFAAFRMLKQDVDLFEAQIDPLVDDFGTAFGMTNKDLIRDAIKAKMCGRWPNGTPLALFNIHGDTPPPDLPRDQRNNFQYDPKDVGQICPYGSHIRRANARNSTLRESPPVTRRIMRRAMPYQRPYVAENRDTGERGLMGLFMGASLNVQFEFVMDTWINSPNGFGPVLDTTDPLLGTYAPPDANGNPQPAQFYLSTPSDPPKFPWRPHLTMNNLITTRGSAYLFIPGLQGVQWIADRTGPAIPYVPIPRPPGP